MKKILVTYHANQEFDYEKIAFERFEKYAKKCNAKFIKIDLNNKLNENFSHAQKYSIEKYFKIKELEKENFDKALIIDTDVLIREDSPDIFELSKDKLCAFNEGSSFLSLHNPENRKEEIQYRLANIQQLIKNCKLFPIPELNIPTCGFKKDCFKYFNFGVQVINKKHLSLFHTNEEIKNKLRTCSVYGPEQAYFNYLLIKEKIEMYSLPNCFNQMVSTFKYNYLDTSYFVHYAGFKKEARSQHMLEDNEIWKSKKI